MWQNNCMLWSKCTGMKLLKNRFKNGEETVEDEPHSGRPSTSMNTEIIEKVRQLVRADWRITLHEVANEVGISYGSTQASVTQ
jgi:hypothetical protein